MTTTPCAECGRNLFADETECGFCGAPWAAAHGAESDGLSTEPRPAQGRSHSTHSPISSGDGSNALQRSYMLAYGILGGLVALAILVWLLQ